MAKSRVLLLLLLVAAAGATGAYVFLSRADSRLVASPEPIASRGGASAGEYVVPGVPFYLQFDPRWSAETLGGSGETMAAAGCTITCTAMALGAAGYEIDPGALNRELKARDGFTSQGYLVWKAVTGASGERATVGFPPLTHQAIEAELAGGRPVVAKIMLNEAVPHWVLIVGKRGEEFLVHDPLDAGKSPIPLSTRASRIYSVRSVRTA